MNRRIVCILALAVTAVVLLVQPGAPQKGLPGVDDADRELLRVWVVSAIGGGQAWLTSALRSYEREHPGVMTYLRSVQAEELTAMDAVLPDLVIYMPGDVTDPSLFAPLSGAFEADEALLRCGRWQGRQMAVPLCWTGYLLAVSASLDPSAPTPAPTALLGRPAVTQSAATTPSPGYPLTAANQTDEALQAALGAPLFALCLLPEVRPSLPASFGTFTQAEVYQRYLASSCASAVLTGGQVLALEGLAAAGKAPAFRVMAPDTVITDQVWLGSIPKSASPLAAELLGWLTGQTSQRLLSAQALHPASSALRLYPVGAPALLLDRAAARSLTAINAFIPREDVHISADQAFRGLISLDEALLPLI